MVSVCIVVCLDTSKGINIGAMMDASGNVTVSKVDEQTYKNEFESHWVPH